MNLLTGIVNIPLIELVDCDRCISLLTEIINLLLPAIVDCEGCISLLTEIVGCDRYICLPKLLADIRELVC